MKGYANNKELIKSLGDSGRAYENETIVENDSAILFIDEGDLYYHPEWQRLYISDLCKIIEEAVPCNLQIIIATNSPFILSDILKIILSSCRRKGKARNPTNKPSDKISIHC